MSNSDLEKQFDDIIKKIIDDVKTWRGGDLFRMQHQFLKNNNQEVHTALFRVHNHIADFDSKYNLAGDFFHTSNSWLIARQWDMSINDDIITLMEEYNDKYPTLSFEVIEPGNVLKITCLEDTAAGKS